MPIITQTDVTWFWGEKADEYDKNSDTDPYEKSKTATSSFVFPYIK